MTTDAHDGPQVTMPKRVLQSEDGVFFSSFPPQTAGFLRGLAEAVAGGALTAGASWLESGPDVPPEFALYIPLLIVLLRTVEGIIDGRAKT